jgi:hypothetical protein
MLALYGLAFQLDGFLSAMPTILIPVIDWGSPEFLGVYFSTQPCPS